MLARSFRTVAQLILFVTAIVPNSSGDDLLPEPAPSTQPFGDVPLYKVDRDTKPNNTIDAGKPLKDLGDPQRVNFVGNKLFSQDQLRAALAADVRYQAAARPSNDLGSFLRILNERVLEGYRHCGCRDATVAASANSAGDAIEVHVNEGARFIQGKICVFGPAMIDKAAIEKFLTTRQAKRPWRIMCSDLEVTKSADDDPIWAPGDDVHFTEAAKTDLAVAVRQALAEQGYPYAHVQTEMAAAEAPNTANLWVEVKGLSSAAQIDKIEVSGLKRNTSEQVLKFLNVSTGDTLTAKLLDRLDEQLKDSCRFWTVGITARVRPETTAKLSEPVGAVLQLELEEYAPVPPLGEPLAPADDVLRKAALLLKNVGTTAKAGADLVFEGGGGGDLFSGVKFNRSVVTTNGRAVLQMQTVGRSAWKLDHGLLIEPNAFAIYDWKGKEKFEPTDTGLTQVTLNIATSHGDDGECQAKMNISGGVFGTGDQPSAQASGLVPHVEPIALVYLAHKKDAKVAVRDGELTYSDDMAKLRLDERTGRLIELRLATSARGKDFLTARLESGAFDKATKDLHERGSAFENAYDCRQPTASTIKFAIGQIEKQPVVQLTPTLLFGCRVANRLQSNKLFTRMWDRALNPDDVANAGNAAAKAADRKRGFHIPSQIHGGDDDDFSGIVRDISQFTPLAADLMFPRGSWPWTVAREPVFLQFADITADATPKRGEAMWAEEFGRLANEEVGPFGAILLAKYYQFFEKSLESENAAAIAQWGMHDLSDEACLRDIRLMADGDLGLALVCRMAADEFGKETPLEQYQLMSGLPKVWKQALQRLAKRRADNPVESVSKSIHEAFLDSWHAGLKDYAEAEMRSMTTTSVARKPGAGTIKK
ncbi:MAG TPA: hypothetical protein VHU84_10925 [Lacipirellulaceae bacterium]|nr:hypothetical protein [Lacipirellulaceae bacterium]